MSFTPGFGNGLPPKKRHTVTNSGPLGPRKRPRTGSTAQSRPRKYHLEGKYCDDYRILFNEVVHQAAKRFVSDVASQPYDTWQIGASLWSRDEQATFYAALERLGKDDIPGIANAIGTKSIPETRALLLLLEDAAAKQGDANVTLRDIPAALDVSDKCNEQLDLAAEALAWKQERYEAHQEKNQFGDYWLITPDVAQKIEAVIDSDQLPDPATAIESEGESRQRRVSLASGACLSCKKLKEKCDRKAPCGNCQKRNKDTCDYPDRSAKTKVLQAATLLRPQVMVELSKDVFMNRSPTIPSPWPHWSEYTSDIAQEPSIYATAFGDFHNLVVSLTRRLVQTAIIQASMRLRSELMDGPHSVSGLVRESDVRAAIDILGMQRNRKQIWIGVARRCALRVYDGEASRWNKRRFKREMPWDEVESSLTLASLTADTPKMDAETSGDKIQSWLEAVRSGTPLPMEDLALSDTDELMLDEVLPISQPQQQPQDFAGKYVRPSVDEDDEDNGDDGDSEDGEDGEDDEMLAPELASLEQFDRQASRQEEENLWAMLEPSKDDGDKGDDSEDDPSEDNPSQDDPSEDNPSEDNPNEDNPSRYAKIITLPNGWRSWTDYHAEWEEFDTMPEPTQFTANQKPLAISPVLHTTESEDSGADDLGSRQQTKQRKRELVVSELQILGSQAYANRQMQAFTEGEPSRASDSEAEATSEGDVDDENIRDGDVDGKDISDRDGDSEGMNRPMQSVDTDARSLLSVSEDEDANMVSEPIVPTNSRGNARLPAHSDDELSEMDWNSFIG